MRGTIQREEIEQTPSLMYDISCYGGIGQLSRWEGCDRWLVSIYSNIATCCLLTTCGSMVIQSVISVS
jgi:hypothetical protein